MLAVFTARHIGEENLPAEVSVRHSSSSDLKAGFISQHSSSQDLLTHFTTRHTATAELYNEFTVRQFTSEDLLAKIRVTTPTLTELKAQFTVRHSGSKTLHAEFHSGQNSANLQTSFTVRQPSSEELLAHFAIRPEWPLWTNRRYLNSVLEVDEWELDDPMLETVIVGVMNNIKSWFLGQGLSIYTAWTTINVTPRAIIRATTFGVVASLYARRLFFPINRVLIRRLPVEATVITNKEEAMDYWEERMEVALDAYFEQFRSPIVVDTEDEEPVFTMEDIPLYKWN
jgi:hypothetical protein